MSIEDEHHCGIPHDTLAIIDRHLDYADEQAWIPWAWAYLARAGDVPAELDNDHPDYATHLVTLASLGHLFELFQQVLHRGNASLEPTIELSGDERPRLTDIEIARFCQRHDIRDLAFPESGYGLAQQAIVEHTPKVRARLLEIAGEERLIGSLVVGAKSHEALCPNDDDEFSGARRIPDGPIGLSLRADAFDSYADEVLSLGADTLVAYEWLCGFVER